MDNSLGLDVHGATTAPTESQRTEPPERYWGDLIVDQDPTEPREQHWGDVEAVQDPTERREQHWGDVNAVQDQTEHLEQHWGDVDAVPDPAEQSERHWGDAGVLVRDPSEPPESLKQNDKNKKEKSKPYVPAIPATRAKMTPDELAERMEKIRLQNEKIKQRREHVKADEEAFKTSVAADRAKQAANRRVQAQINHSREQNAKRKLEKMGVREWDSGKQGGEWKQGKRPTEDIGKANSFTNVAGRDTGGSGISASKRNTAKGSLTALTDSANSLREKAPHATKSHPDPSPDVNNDEKHES